MYLRAKSEVSSIILTIFRQGQGGGGVILHSPSPQNKPLNSPPRLGLSIRFAEDLKMDASGKKNIDANLTQT